MPFKIVRNDITKMTTEAIVNTANNHPTVGTGCDYAVYEAAGFEELLAYREEKIGYVEEGEAFITPGFGLPAKYIIHAVSPHYVDGEHGEEELLRSCYRKSLALAAENGIRSIAFPLISTGGFGYPKEEGMRIAVDEIHAFLLTSQMEIYLVVFDEKATQMGQNLFPDLDAYIDRHYVEEKRRQEYAGTSYSADMARAEAAMPSAPGAAPVPPSLGNARTEAPRPAPSANVPSASERRARKKKKADRPSFFNTLFERDEAKAAQSIRTEDEDADACLNESIIYREESDDEWEEAYRQARKEVSKEPIDLNSDEAIEELERRIQERLKHLSDTFQEYLFYLIGEKGLTNADVYKRAIVDKKVFSKIKNNTDYHPQKRTALCLCIGAKLNLDEAKDLLARAGYALSPCDKTDIIFSYFIENGIYNMIELDIQLEEHGLPCLIP